MATHTTLYISGADLCGRDSKKIILRGVNYPLLDDWNFPGKDSLTEIAKTGANAVRIQWYINYGSPDGPLTPSTISTPSCSAAPLPV